MLATALRGLLLGFAIAATPGPMFFLCARRTLLQGWRAGVTAGLGGASGDGIYAAAAAAGVGAMAAGFAGARHAIALAGGLVLAAIGLRAIFSRPASVAADVAALRPGRVYAASLGLTLANPATIAAFAALFAGLGMGAGVRGPGAALLVAATAAGSLAWWVLLATGVAVVRRRLDERAARGLGLVSGAALLAFGAITAGSALLAR